MRSDLPTVLYTDPPWALTPDGRSDPDRAVIEREIFGNYANVVINSAVNGKYALDGEAFHKRLSTAHALAICRFQITNEAIAGAMAGLKVVARQGVGVDNLNAGLLAEHGIVGFNIPDYCVDEVATQTCALALTLERQIVPQHLGLIGGSFDVYRGGIPRRLKNCTAGIIGLGRIGLSVAQRLQSFYGRVVAVDPAVSEDFMAAHGVEKASLEDLFAVSDAVFVHCALTPDTRHLIDEAILSLPNRQPYLVNAARGAIIDPAALSRALDDGRIAGCGIDVFQPENPHECPDWRAVLATGRVVVSSHRAFLSVEAEESQRRRAAEGILDVLVRGSVPAVGLQTPPPASLGSVQG